jgi:hypothetical protein
MVTHMGVQGVHRQITINVLYRYDTELLYSDKSLPTQMLKQASSRGQEPTSYKHGGSCR